MGALRRWRPALLGLLLLGGCIAFFVVTAMHDSQLLRVGTPVTATVVDHEPASQWWNPMDNGRVVVRYQTAQGTLTRGIWLDDSASAPTGNTWTVIYDPARPGRVRSVTDANDPVPWAPPVLLVGLAGLALVVLALIRAGLRRTSIDWTAGSAFSAGSVSSRCSLPAVRIPLRHYRWFSHEPFVEVAGEALWIYLPSYFGAQPLVVPVANACVVDAAHLDSQDDDGEGWVFRRPLLIPYAATTSSNVAGNLSLLFSRPVRIPPLRWIGARNLGVPRGASRSVRGVRLDGLELRAVDPEAAVAALAAAGVERTQRPNSWLREHHPITHDPTEVQQVARSVNRRHWLGRLALAAVVLVSVVRLVDHPSWEVVGVGATCLGLIWLPRWGERRH